MRFLRLASRTFASAASSSTKPPFSKLLVANRGEIACRIMRTAKRMGIKTVAIYSEADELSKHVRFADEAVCVGPPPSSQSYLNHDAIIDAMRKTGAEALHPGYGFVSENPKFVERLEQAGFVFIGPPPTSMIAMSDKIESKKLAKSAGVNVIPGYTSDVHSPEEVLKIANEIGYPVMVKASAGGGGKGMRVVWNDKEALEGYRLCKEEAKGAFGNDRMFIEKFIEQPRHIEIQVLGDKFGNVLYLPERECSIQRRNQKVIEEAPSKFLDRETWHKMGKQAVSLAKAVGYFSAGTVEMLVDPKKNFYFLEMNTRLQVEHPITEYVTGLDLVEHMINVAAGKPLPMKQSDITITGWATEARVYAEDPYRNFLPSIGSLKSYIEPGKGDSNVRVDSGITQGSEISIYYDPIISKLVTYGKDRDESILNMRHALDSYYIRGVEHNVPFLRAVLDNPRYLEGRLSTAFIPEEFPKGFKGYQLSTSQRNMLISSAAVMNFIRREWELNVPNQLVPLQLENAEYFVSVNGEQPVERVTVQFDGAVYDVKIGDEDHPLSTSWTPADPVFEATDKDGSTVLVQDHGKTYKGARLQYYGTKYNVQVDTARENELRKFMPPPKEVDTSSAVLSPMPGAVISVAVQKGDKVVLGQEIAVVEAMKMQNMLRAPRDGVVKAVHVKKGATVAVDEILVEFE